ncbi:putative disease resistance protein [Vitis vinifera]|uniref:Putative disease resistance protein n=1 Tax=Vitis vinifera TaxID=29760 RepID=A0A438I7W5_VITVI|nr:putative disease resistance protein [Vitis vinifera]
MEIDDILKLQQVQPGELPATLKKLIIINCEKLESLPEGIDNNNTCHLEYLHVWGCPSLKSIPRGYFPSTLETLSIWDCQQLESIPGNMQQNLTSLQVLQICNCRDVLSSPEAFLNPNLEELCISDCENMRWPLSGWGLHTLTSLDKLMIQGPFPDLLFTSQLSPSSSYIYHMSPVGRATLAILEIWECPILEKRGSPSFSEVRPSYHNLILIFGIALFQNEEFPAIHICKVTVDLERTFLLASGMSSSSGYTERAYIPGCSFSHYVNLGDEPACLRKPGFGLENLGGLWMDGCDGVVSLDEQRLPCNLQYLEVKGCFNLEKLPNALCTLTSLIDLLLETLADGMVSTRCAFECLEIVDCPSLIRLPKGKLSTTLKKLLIIDCQKLESLPEGIMHHTSIYSNNTCRLEQLHVLGCSSLKCIPRGNFPSFLEMLFIWNCKKLEPIPGNMLQNLTALDCENMKKPLSFVPKEGLPPSLARLVIMGVLF